MRSRNTTTTATGTGQWRLGFWSSKARKRAAEDKLDQIRESTRNSLVTVEDDTGNLKFLPAGKINALTNALDVETVMSYDRTANPDLVRFVCTEAQKIFLSLVLQQGVTASHMVSIMKDCLRHGVNDRWLPVECSRNPRTARCNCPQTAHATGWEVIKVVYHLQDIQWWLLSPVFSSEEFVYNIPSRCVLPFLKLDSKGKHGHFSIVHKATLHPDHLKMGQLRGKFTNDETERGIQVALKELKNVDDSPDYNVEKAWEHEVSCLARISTLCHPNLIRPLAGIKKGAKHYIMFEWADGGSLRDIWIREGQNPKSLDGARIISFLEQFCGLTGALLAMHNPNGRIPGPTDGNESVSTVAAGASRGSSISILRPRPAQDPQSLQVPELRLPGEHSSEEGSFMSEDPDVHWRHGDLKPDNILVFKTATDSGSWLGTLKIADLGLAKQHVFSTSNRIQPTGQRYTTSQYEAPEAMPSFREPRSRKYDIWSMGCIILEFVILLLYGGSGLNVFYGEHRNEGNTTDTLYFTVTDRGRGLAEVSNIADHWIRSILQDCECTREGRSVFRDLVLLVKDKLLVVDYTRRIGADDLAEELAAILKEARHSAMEAPCYLFGRKDRADVKTPGTSGGRVVRTRRSRSQFLGDDLPRIHTPQTPTNQV
ncbi:Protein kinase-like domain containing protein [Naviculisporaceae sp. PSN 640]